MTSKRPTSSELLVNPNVISGIRQAYVASDVGGSQPREQGGFLVRDAQTDFTAIRFPASSADSFSFPLCLNGLFQGQEIVGSFHTHPNTGPEWRQEPSPQDIRVSKEYPETMGMYQFVISRENVYQIDNDGLVTVVGRTAEVLKLGDEEPNP